MARSHRPSLTARFSLRRPGAPAGWTALALAAALAAGCASGGDQPDSGLDRGDASEALDASNGLGDGGPGGDTDGAMAGDERCGDGVDDDADGRVDEGCGCVDGATQPCWLGDPAMRGEGVCTDGVQTCGSETASQWGACVGESGPTEPTEQSCVDGVDQDCDGLTDCVDPDCLGQSCGAGAVCRADGACAACAPRDESCNGEDDDCDGRVDEGVSRACGSMRAGCMQGSQRCQAGEWGACEGAGGTDEEICDGRDQDCDGMVDEGISQPCGTDEGVCRAGSQTCVMGVFGECVGGVEGHAEECNGADDDCDGRTDEDASGGSESTSCDGDDDDCDGYIDEFPCADCSQMVRVDGSNHALVSIIHSRRLFPSGASSAALVGVDTSESGPNPDGVLAGSVARRRGGPVLATPRTGGLDPDTRAELVRLGTSRVYIIGGLASVSAATRTDVANMGIAITEHRGINRAETARAVAMANGAPAQRAFIVNGYGNLADAAVVAGLAGRLGYPILFVDRDLVPGATSDALTALNVTRTYVIGGTGAISSSVMSQLPSPVRLSGMDRVETARAVADYALRTWNVPSGRVSLINQAFPVDAMTAGAAGTIHLFTDTSTIPPETRDFLTAHKPDEGWLMVGQNHLDTSVERSFCSSVSH